ncbi:oxidoreductase [Brevirhabdus pacifica]|uniref:Oxidoreductase n=2 Tax=Brevirhabdus pacifica TaxID=1267768 RepID=A0A1U7DKV1_9RHOB|nr:nitronate monooxygenase [Brevirhabdus pacifica]APX90601.1 oxidoreductase [Brevirhabdus pacifica]OWU78403.1 oxidoreductase [Loktanella sp. 22II-4b]PJJ85261.1 nitronate monooxygenase [Brevirhabdus pacifica]
MADTGITTRLTRRLGLTHPILSAPMAVAAGGALAAAVTRAGGLGLIGGGYGDAGWIEAERAAAGNETTGIGFITWRLEGRAELLEQALAHKPAALMLSFGDPAPYAPLVLAAGVPLIAQVQTLRDARHAADSGADIIVAQGAEAGGHGETRATMTLVPEVADMLAREHPQTLLLAAGGIADGRGLAAALMLGADGVLVGSRLWASAEALVPEGLHRAALAAGGDDTLRSSVPDIARGLDWPDRYDIRTLRNAYTERWARDPQGQRAAGPAEADRYTSAASTGDATIAPAVVGEATGLIHDIRPAAQIIADMAQQAAGLLSGGWRRDEDV